MKNHINVVAACIIQNNKLFAVRRSYGSQYVIHKLEFVGGKVEEGEEERQALIRECREELACEIEVGKHFLTSTYSYPDKEVTLSVWFARMKTSYILKEHEEAIFLPLDQLDLNDWAPADQTFLVALRKRYQKTFTLITGATGVLGAEFALLCAARGENLYLTGRSEQKLQECKEHILACYPEVEVMLCACDLVDEHSREKLMQDAEGLRFARLINVAGADIQKPFADYTQEKLTFQTRVCFEGAVSMCHFALSHRADRLRILNISSVSGIYPMPYFAIYSAAKAALTQFSVAIAREVKGENVSVTVVLPGAIYTRPDVVEYIKTQGLWGRLAAKSPSYVAQKALQLSDKGRRKAVIGFANKCMAFFTRLVPEGIRLRYIAKRWKRTTKDAF